MSLDEDGIKDHLKSFKSTFSFEKRLNKQTAEEILKKLQRDSAATNKATEEKIWINNFLSYLHHLLQNSEEALKHCEESLKLDQKNVTANTNKCYLLLERDDISQAQNVMQLLLKMKKELTFSERMYDADADIAYAYSRAGPLFLKKAEDIYKTVIPFCPKKYHWKFGLGLILLRQTHYANSPITNIRQRESTILSEAIDHFYDVACNTQDKILCANAWTEIGEILYGNKKSRNTKCIKLPEKLKCFKPLECFQKAYLICPDDPFVLERCGKYYRYYVKIDESERMLRSALQIRETAFAYHHLALTLKRKIEIKPFSDERVKRMQSLHYMEVVLNSPPEVLVYPENKTLLEAVNLIRKALDISNTPSILYELALLQRMLDRPGQALDTLNCITSEKQFEMSLIALIKVYEQKGMCFLSLGKCASDFSKKQKHEENANHVFFKAIELQAKMIREGQMLKDIWHSYPTLKDLLEAKSDRASIIKLVKIHKLMNEEEQAIDLLHRIKEQGDGVFGADQYKDLVESYVKIGNLKEAMVLLQFLECTKEFEKVDKKLFVDNYILGALDSIKESDFPMASARIRSAYQIARKSKYEMQPLTNYPVVHECSSSLCKPSLSNHSKPLNMEIFENVNDQHNFEIHIVHKCENYHCLFARKLLNILQKYTDFKATVNTEHALGEYKFSAMESTMYSSEHVVLLVDKECYQEAEYYWNCALQVNEKRKNLMVVINESLSLPNIFTVSSIPKVYLPGNYWNYNVPGNSDDKERHEVEVLERFLRVVCSM